MTQLLPQRSELDVGDHPPEVVGIDDETADAVFPVLTSRTARSILVELYREPTTQSDLADRTGTSLQNLTYHLSRLEDSELIEVVDTWYSSRGTEMDVYAPSNGPLVLVAGEVDGDGDGVGAGEVDGAADGERDEDWDGDWDEDWDGDWDEDWDGDWDEDWDGDGDVTRPGRE